MCFIATKHSRVRIQFCHVGSTKLESTQTLVTLSTPPLPIVERLHGKVRF